MFSTMKMTIRSLALVAILAPTSSADGFGIAFTKRIHHGALSLGFSTGPFWGRGCEERPAPTSWVPGHYETVYQPVWIEGCAERIWVKPVYEWQYRGCGRPYRACVRGGHFKHVRNPGHYESRAVQVWVEGAWRS